MYLNLKLLHAIDCYKNSPICFDFNEIFGLNYDPALFYNQFMSNSIKAIQNNQSKKPTWLGQQQTLKPASKTILENIDNKIKFSVFNFQWFQLKKYI